MQDLIDSQKPGLLRLSRVKPCCAARRWRAAA